MPIATSLIYNVQRESRRRSETREQEGGNSKECITACSEQGEQLWQSWMAINVTGCITNWLITLSHFHIEYLGSQDT